MLEDVIITKNNASSHKIDKYHFNILGNMKGASVYEAAEELGLEHIDKQPASRNENHTSQESQGSSNNTQKDELIESLLKKADDMSSNFIKMQMRLEDVQEEHARMLEEARKASYEEGFLAGIAQERSQNLQENVRGMDQLSSSVKTLEEAAEQYEITLAKIQKELTQTALEIAQEVIVIETHENSAKIAAKLSETLIEELGEASRITLRVNPADHGAISEKVGSLKHVEVLSDRAISIGGVVAISDLGNIDSQIKKRFERLKRSLLLDS